MYAGESVAARRQPDAGADAAGDQCAVAADAADAAGYPARSEPEDGVAAEAAGSPARSEPEDSVTAAGPGAAAAGTEAACAPGGEEPDDDATSAVPGAAAAAAEAPWSTANAMMIDSAPEIDDRDALAKAGEGRVAFSGWEGEPPGWRWWGRTRLTTATRVGESDCRGGLRARHAGAGGGETDRSGACDVRAPGHTVPLKRRCARAVCERGCNDARCWLQWRGERAS